MGKFLRIILIISFYYGTASAQMLDAPRPEGPESFRTFDTEAAANESANPDNHPVVYPVDSALTIFSDREKEFPYIEVAMREPLFVLEDLGETLHVKTTSGSTGYVSATSVSDYWIRVSKSKRTVWVYKGDALFRKLPADLAINFFSDKVKRGGQEAVDHWRTPEGVFYVVSKNDQSLFHRAFVLNYPGPEDARRGLEQGIISKAEHDQILRADERFTPPPMFTSLGGLIEIHGDGTGARTNWTRGCIAIRNDDIDELWDLVQVGAPVIIEK